MKISTSVKIAGATFAALIAYFVVRSLFGGGAAADTASVEEQTAERFTVVVQSVAPQNWRDAVTVRGRTEAVRNITIRAETSGVVAETPTALGAAVQEGDILCRLKVDARSAQLSEARAALSKARLDYNAAKKLFEDGFRAETGVATAKAALDQARASVQRATVELDKTEIRAPFAGVFDRRTVEVGDFMNVGDPCGVLIERNPFLVTGALSERDVAKVAKGDRGVARLATGEEVEGAVRFVASSADAQTRTFDVELEIPNKEGAIRDGVTADFTIFAAETLAHQVPHSALTQNDAGEVGVRIVNGDDKVEFAKISILGESASGVWIKGLEGERKLIVRGQEYVKAGQVVDTADGGSYEG